ncbi:cadherin-like beta sandwich domain-containing protein [Paenibacillus sp. GYB004]|uniref:cadherin-like beta sandwich domain-containing protein n=1 Tax=Paenibacillus sp. GYB004 TaxID=2994393 RepID=UPI002F96B754
MTAENGVSVKTYTVQVRRSASRNANLSGIHANPLTLDFQPERLSYEAETAYDVKSIQLTPTAVDSQASVQVLLNEKPVEASAGGNYVIDLQPGANLVKLLVTAADGESKKLYRLTVQRAFLLQADAGDNAELQSLTLRDMTTMAPIRLGSDFVPEIKTYSASADHTAAAVALRAVVADEGASVVVTMNGRPVPANDQGIYLSDDIDSLRASKSIYKLLDGAIINYNLYGSRSMLKHSARI